MITIFVLLYLIPLLLTARRLLFRWEASPYGVTDWDDPFDVVFAILGALALGAIWPAVLVFYGLAKILLPEREEDE